METAPWAVMVAPVAPVATPSQLARTPQPMVEPAEPVEMVPWVVMAVREAMLLRMVTRLPKPGAAMAAMGEPRVVLVGRAAQAPP